MEKPEALFLADELEAPLGTIIGAELYRRAAAELRRLDAENESLRQIIADCPPIEAELQEVSDRAHRAEAQRDALLEALEAMLEQFNYHTITGIVHDESAAIDKARAAIAAVEREKE